MIRGFYAASSSLSSQQINLNVIANNISNVSTTGFKPQQVGFSTLLYENINSGLAPINCGHGVKAAKTDIDFSQGELARTDMQMDCAIMGEGFFAVQNREDGTIAYTRDGSFHIASEGKKAYLVNAAGDYVMDSKNKKIPIEKIKAADNESESAMKWDFDAGKIGVFSFNNNYGLKLMGENRFADTENSGSAQIVSEPNIKVGYLENAAVNIAKEMAKMIESSKGFTFGSKIVQVADELEKTINQLR